MGRKRALKPKKDLKIKVDVDLLDKLNADGINKSRLFSVFAEMYYNKDYCKDCTDKINCILNDVNKNS